MIIMYGNDAFSILVLWKKKWFYSFLKKVFVFQKICKVKVWKTFKVSTDCHIESGRSLKRRAILNILVLFLEEPMLFVLALKWKLQEKVFSSVKIKTNSNFAVKLAEWSNYSFLLSIWRINFFQTSVLFNMWQWNL